MITDLDIQSQSRIIATGHRDGKVRLWSLNENKKNKIATLNLAINKEVAKIHDDSITSVNFSKSDDGELS